MRFLHILDSIKSPPKSLYLADIALVLAILPHLGSLRFPMLVYLLVVGAVLSIKRDISKSVQYGLMVFGLFSVISSFYTDFNFSSFSKFALYLSFLNALLIYAVTLQRMKGEVNFYLLFSPAMLLMLSFFLHNSVTMLFYMVFALFIFLLLLLWNKMNCSLTDVVKMSFSIFAYALPVVAVLFLVFPRISFEKADYGFQDELVKRSGHNGQMSLGNDALLVPSSQVIMELYFTEKLSPGKELYFRGTTLYVDSNDSFRQLQGSYKEPLRAEKRATALSQRVDYKVTLYPHNEKWLYALDIPTSTPSKSTLYDDYTLEHNKKIDNVYRYTMHSYLSYKMDAPISKALREVALQVDKARDPISARVAMSLKSDSDVKTLDNLTDYFQSLDLTYTLKPDPLDSKKPIDSFLQGTKKGYCVHFAAAFTYMARTAGLPTRIVSGFMVNTDDALDNYLVVREYTAHAWVEVYLDGTGWKRVETTAFANHMEQDALQNIGTVERSTMEELLEYTNLRFMYAKYVVENWILEYSRVKQMEILNKLLHDTLYLVKFVFYGILFLLFSLLLGLYVNTKRCKDPLECILSPLHKTVQKAGLLKQNSESMHDFLQRLQVRYHLEELNEIDRLYHIVKYAREHQQKDILQLKLEVTRAVKMIRQRDAGS